MSYSRNKKKMDKWKLGLRNGIGELPLSNKWKYQAVRGIRKIQFQTVLITMYSQALRVCGCGL